MSSFPFLLAFTDANQWRPGIGDPTAMGWLTVAAYLVAAVISFKASRDSSLNEGDIVQARFWGFLALMLFMLGINKQLDLQTWFTLTARKLAVAEGWYGKRRAVQLIFIVAIALGAAGLSLVCWWLVARHSRALWLPLLGFCILSSFVVIRAASFHHVDQFLHFRIGGIKMNWLLELGGISIVIIGALCRSRFQSDPTDEVEESANAV